MTTTTTTQRAAARRSLHLEGGMVFDTTRAAPGLTSIGRHVAAAAELEGVARLPPGTYGNVSLGEGQSCILGEGVTIDGNFQATNPVHVIMEGPTVRGNVTIEGATGVVAIAGATSVTTTHIHGNVTVSNTDQSEIPLDEEAVVYVGGQFLGEDPDSGEPQPYSTLHIHGNLTLTDNTVNFFYAGDLASKLIVDKNVTIERNALTHIDLHVYNMAIGKNLVVVGNVAPAFTSVLCNDVAGNVTIADNVNPGVELWFGPPGVWAQIQVATNGAGWIPGFPLDDATIEGNLTISGNMVGDGSDVFAEIIVYETTVLNNLSLASNVVDAVEESIQVVDSYVGGNLTCRNNTPDAIEDGGGNVIIGRDRCTST